MPTRLLLASSLVSVALLVGLGGIYAVTDSELVLAQAADSLADALTGLGLLWALRVSQRPPDEEHHYGHHGAQPIAALVVAMLVGALALEVFSQAVDALYFGHSAELVWPIAAGLGAKAVIKAFFVWRSSDKEQLRRNAALRAFRVDAISDLLVGLLSVLGFVIARATGWHALDAWLALPVAVWIGFNGITLAKESIDLLMGTAPSQGWREARELEVAALPGVRKVADLKARAFGDHTHVWVEIHVDPELTVASAHDIGEAVEASLEEHADITDAVVHVDAAIEEEVE